MKKIRLISIVCIVFGGFALSCRRSVTAGSDYYVFDTTITLNAQLIRIDELLKPVDLVLLDDYIVVVNEPNGDHPVFNVYTRADMTFLYGFGRQGKGPLEYISFATPGHRSDNILPVYNNVSNTLVCYEIEDDGERVLSSLSVNKTTPGIMQRIVLVNDSVMLYSVLNNKGVGTYSFNLNTNEIIDTLDLITPYRREHGIKFENYKFDYRDNALIAAFEYVDEIVRVEMTDDFHFSPSVVKLSHDDGPLDEVKMNNIAYFSYPYVGEKRIYAERIGRPMKEMQPFYPGRNFKFDIFVFDRELQPLYRLKFDRNIIRFVVDEDANVLYSWDMMDAFDYIHRYSLPDME